MSRGLTRCLVLDSLSASSPPSEHADWLELRALAATNGTSSYNELARALKTSGTADAVSDSRREDEEIIDGIADAASYELGERYEACGSQEIIYPFMLDRHTVSLKPDHTDSLYIFLLLLSSFGKDAGPSGTHGDRVFEDVCAQAAESYFGGPSEYVHSRVFGFPRAKLPVNFEAAVNQLCHDMGEGTESRTRPSTAHLKDDKLDIVTWAAFPDKRPGKLIGFGQCATGNNWREKKSELKPQAWCGKRLMRNPLILPTPLFFVPHRIDSSEWDETTLDAGVVFDRCRIAFCSQELGEDLYSTCVRWSNHAIEKQLRPIVRNSM